MQSPDKRNTKVYLVEDQDLVKAYISEMLESTPEFELVGSATNAEDALRDLEKL